MGTIRPLGRSTLDRFEEPERHTVPMMNVECRHCEALRFASEPRGLCCNDGQVQIPDIPDLPESLHTKLVSDTSFRKDIRKYNQVFAFASLAADVDRVRYANQTEGVYTFRIHGQVHHQMGSVLPNEGQEPKFAQIYFYDKEIQVNRRTGLMDLDRDNVRFLTELMETNPYVSLYQQAREIEGENFSIAFHSGNVDCRRYNAPTVSEVGAILMDEAERSRRDVVIRKRGGGLKQISETHSVGPSCMTSNYPSLTLPI